MKTDTAIILAGGFGTRLQSVVKDVPKPMADIAGRPFLQYLFDYLLKQGLSHAVLSVGYKWETIQDYFGDKYNTLQLTYSVEDSPLGTGGAILKAMSSVEKEEVFILNGDTFFNINLKSFESKHLASGAGLSLALKSMKNFDRYGVVRTNDAGKILSFEEKNFYAEGNINGGVYLLKKELFASFHLPEKFSFEKEVMEKYCRTNHFTGFPFNDYFIDIGIPEDYDRAQKELPEIIKQEEKGLNARLPFSIDSSWSLFLDRDGVINKKIDDDYVRHLGQFEWLPGAQEAIIKLSRIFGHIFIVSNQQGVGKKLMTHEDVEAIHHHITESITQAGGRIDRIYFAPQLKSENSDFRKPNTGMALQAKKEFPEVDFSRSVMVGDSISDMEFGGKSGMKTVFILNGKTIPAQQSSIDFFCQDLHDFYSSLDLPKVS